MTPSENRDPIVIADAGPLIRLAAAGLLESMRGLNRRIVIVDRVEDEVCGDPSKPHAEDVSRWLAQMGPAIVRARTVEGAGIEALRDHARTSQDFEILKRKLRHSGERAIREYVEDLGPGDVHEVLVVYEDYDIPRLMQAAQAAVTLMTTRAFAARLVEWGVNRDAANDLERIRDRYSLKPSVHVQMEPTAEDHEDVDGLTPPPPRSAGRRSSP